MYSLVICFSKVFWFWSHLDPLLWWNLTFDTWSKQNDFELGGQYYKFKFSPRHIRPEAVWRSPWTMNLSKKKRTLCILLQMQTTATLSASWPAVNSNRCREKQPDKTGCSRTFSSQRTLISGSSVKLLPWWIPLYFKNDPFSKPTTENNQHFKSMKM